MTLHATGGRTPAVPLTLWLSLLVLLASTGAAGASHVPATDIRWACGFGGGGQTGHPDRCGIDPVNDPEFGDAWIDGDERVMGVVVNGEARAYPVSVLTRHEIVNDVVGGVPVAVTFCPLCGSGITFDATVAGEVRTFTASGFLYEHDLVMMDAETGTLWTQIRGEAVGTLVDESVRPAHPDQRLTFYPSVIASWNEWKTRQPTSLVLQPPLGEGSYASDPYAGGFGRGSYYESCEQGISGRGPCDIEGLHPKQLVIGIWQADGNATAFPLDAVAQAGGAIQHGPFLVVSNDGGQTGRAWHAGSHVFERTSDGFWQADGQAWDVAAGRAEDGTQLEPVATAITSFWFAWKTHHPETNVWIPPTYKPDLEAKETPWPGIAGTLIAGLLAAVAAANKVRTQERQRR